ncbi:MAG: GNAT family N-acetyltransferase [Acidobacteriia bacterium]|nr:GNAT family N-acetyltransferase [Terriglobia bacterium]
MRSDRDWSGPRVLDPDDSGDLAEWLRLWSDWPEREVQAHPGYGRLFLSDASERLACLAWQGAEGAVLYPFILRDLSAAQWWSPGEGPTFDIVTPYGYGGPYLLHADDPKALARRFWPELDRWAVRQGVVSEFVRFSLFREALLDYPGETEQKLLNVVRDLRPDPEALWMDFEHKVRKNVKKARRSDVRVEVDPAGARIEDFLRIYRQTLDRRGADPGYYFSPEFFASLHRVLPEQFAYFHAIAGSRVVSTELVLLSASTAYSLLGGTDQDAFELRPNDLLKFEIMLWLRQRGFARFVLGGGYEPDDGIFRYKASFAPGSTLPFVVGKRVLLPDLYERLVDSRRQNERKLGREWSPKLGYFPEYRG